MSTPNFETAIWRASSYSSQGGDCVEVADGFPGVLPVRDSKDPEGACLVFCAGAWTAFVGALSVGELPGARGGR